MSNIIIGVGYNIAPPETTASDYLQQVIRVLEKSSVKVVGQAPLYKSLAMGMPGQPDYTNTVFLIKTHMSANSLLRVLKRTESFFGRRGAGIPWSARTLDLDIIDFKGIIRNNRNNTPFASKGSLYLPHQHAHTRSFVLQPVMDILPGWKHPIYRRSARDLLYRVKRQEKNGPGSLINADI